MRLFSANRFAFAAGVLWIAALLTGTANAVPVRPAPRVVRAIGHDTSKPVRDYAPAGISSSAEGEVEDAVEPDRSEAEVKPETPRSARLASQPPQNDPVLQNGFSHAASLSSLQPTLGLSFDGVASKGWAVSDTNVAVGATQVVQWVNTQYAVYNKTTGALQYGPVNGNTLWSNFGGSCQSTNNGDPVVQYDKAAGRWVMTQHAVPIGGPFYLCVAVSTTSDATGSYNRYAFELTSGFPDYPKLGVWSDGYYMSINQLQGGTVIATACALDRNAMLTGAAAAAVCFQPSSSYINLLPSDLDGSVAPPAGSPNYFMNFGPNALNIWQFHADFQNPGNSTFTGPVNIPVAAFTAACSGGACVPQLNTTQQIDSLADRLMYRLAYRHFSDGHEALVVTHSVGSPSGVRWYEIRSPGTGPVVYQSGTFSPDSNWRWMGSAAMDQAGDIAIGYSLSSGTMRPSVAYTGRLASDPLGTMEPEVIALTGGGSETTGNYRWGDYTSLSLDPIDDCTFWYSNQYYKTDGVKTWSTRILSFKYPTCTAPSVTLSTGSVGFGTQQVGTTSSPQAVVLTNGMTTSLSVSAVTASRDFSQTNNCGTVPAGGTCTVNVSFSPSASGSRSGTLTVTDNAGNSPQTASLSGTGTNLSLIVSPGALSFGNQVVNTTSAGQNLTVTNSGAANVTVNSVTASGNFGETDSCAGVVLAPAASCSITVTFTPTVIASISGAITINDTGIGSPHVAALSGNALVPVTLTTVTFGFTTVGTTSPSQNMVLTNNQSSSMNPAISVSGDYGLVTAASNPCGATLAPNSTCNLAVTFSPTYTGTIKGAVTVAYTGAGSPAVGALSGSGSGGGTVPLSFSPASANFGNVVLNTTSASKTVSIKNVSGSTITFTGVSASGQYTVSNTGNGSCNGTLAPNAKCTVTVTFTPAVFGSITGGLTVTLTGASVGTQIVNLSGTGVLAVTLSPASLGFGTVAVGTTSAVQVITISNNQTTAVPITSVAASGQYLSVTGGSLPCGASVPANSTCTLGVQFNPATTGAVSGAFTFTYNAGSSPQEVALSGTGQ